MARWSGALNMDPLSVPAAWAVLIVFGALFAFVLFWRWMTGRRVPGYLALCEYWIYTPHENLPKQELWMDRMISSNPHNKRGRVCIGAREGLLFSDIRLHIALAKRSKNPNIFRPDLFADDAVPNPEVLSNLAGSNSLIKVRYMSQAHLKDTRHLQFIPHLADTMVDLAEGSVVYDVVCEELYSAEAFTELFKNNSNAERPDFHVRVLWNEELDGTGNAYTRGLKKVGLPELKTAPVEADQEILIVGLLLRIAYQLIRDQSTEGPFEYEEYGDTFILELQPEKGKETLVSIKRRRGV